MQCNIFHNLKKLFPNILVFYTAARSESAHCVRGPSTLRSRRSHVASHQYGQTSARYVYEHVVSSAGAVQRAGGALRGGGRRDGAARALPRPPVRAHARVLGAPRRRAAHVPAPRGRPGAQRHAALPHAQLLPLGAGAGAVRAAAGQHGSVRLYSLYRRLLVAKEIDSRSRYPCASLGTFHVA